MLQSQLIRVLRRHSHRGCHSGAAASIGNVINSTQDSKLADSNTHSNNHTEAAGAINDTANKLLTHQYAQWRYGRISRDKPIEYSYHLTLNKGTTYKGIAQIAFDVLNQSNHTNIGQNSGRILSQTENKTIDEKQIEIDLVCQKILRLIVNGKDLNCQSEHLWRKKGKIPIPIDESSTNKNNYDVIIEYESAYDSSGSGLVSFTDPIDNHQYLYTQFQPYMANRVLPCFDQPDLKAIMRLNAAVESSWETVLANQHPEWSYNDTNNLSHLTQYLKNTQIYNQSHPSPQGVQHRLLRQIVLQNYWNALSRHKVIVFKKTQALPTYLYALVVGPYKGLVISPTHNHIPMSMFCIQSLYPNLLRMAPFLAQITNLSMKFFEKYFGCPYPFSKYDQVFAHEYKWGAMENAGLVTLNDLYLFKGKTSNEHLFSLANTVVHELAHHWFGNLVTMKWWDDLWLNESFAEYISHYCLQKIKGEVTTLPYESAMLSFFYRKSWGYLDDSRPTTHPIAGAVENTLLAETIFDGITYSKGAAVIKQLMYLVGEAAFSKGLTHYFQKFRFANATLSDLLAAMEPYFDSSRVGCSLNDWKKMWIETAGTNLLKCSSFELGNLVIEQLPTLTQHPTLRLHHLKIALISQDHEVETHQVLIQPQARSELKLPTKFTNVAAVLINYEDLTFAKIAIDSQSTKYFEHNLHQHLDRMTRSMVWRSPYGMVEDGFISGHKYKRLSLNWLKKQPSDMIVEEQLGNLLFVLRRFAPQSEFDDEVFNIILAQLYSPSISANRAAVYRDKLIAFAHSDEAKLQLLLWFFGAMKGQSSFELDNPLKWKIIVKTLAGTKSRCQAQAAMKVMIEEDQSDTMLNRKATCEALLSSNAELDTLYQDLLGRKFSNTLAMYKMQGLNEGSAPGRFEYLREVHFYRYFKDLQEILNKGEFDEYMETFMDHLDPDISRDAANIRCKIAAFEKLDAKGNDKARVNITKKVEFLKIRLVPLDTYQRLKSHELRE